MSWRRHSSAEWLFIPGDLNSMPAGGRNLLVHVPLIQKNNNKKKATLQTQRASTWKQNGTSAPPLTLSQRSPRSHGWLQIKLINNFVFIIQYRLFGGAGCEALRLSSSCYLSHDVFHLIGGKKTLPNRDKIKRCVWYWGKENPCLSPRYI